MVDIRGTAQSHYPDVLTAAALDAIARAGATRRRPAGGDGRAHRPPHRPRRARASASRFSIPPRPSHARRSRSQDARDGAFVGSEIPAGPAAAVDSGHRPGRQAGRADREEHPQRRLRAAVRRRRLDVRRRGRARPAGDDVARQPAQPEAGHPSRSGVPARRRAGRRRDERLVAGFFGRPIVTDWRTAARLHHQDLPRPRSAPRRPPRPPRRRRRLLGVDRRSGALRRQQPAARCARRVVARALPAEDPDRRGSGALERHPVGARASSRAAGRARSRSTCWSSSSKRVPADGDPRRARPALRRLQHRPLGLHQQRLRRAGVGSGVRQPEHRRHHDDLRLHAPLRGSRPPRREHARPARPLRAVAGRHGAEHPGRLGGRRRRARWSAPSPAPSASSARAPAASGSPTGRWSTSSGRCGRQAGQDNQLGRAFPPLTYTPADADGADRCSSRRRAPFAARAI